MPNFIASIFNPNLKIVGKNKLFVGEEASYKVNYFKGFTNIWTITGSADTKEMNDSLLTLKFNTQGTIKIKVRGDVCFTSAKDSIEVSVLGAPVVNLGKDTTYCNDEFSRTLNAGSGYTSYLWNTGSNSQIIPSVMPGDYWVRVTNGNGCIGTDSISISSGARVAVNIDDVEICEGQVAYITASDAPGYFWQDGSTNKTFTAFSAGKYWVRVSSSCNTASDTAVVTLKPLPLVTFTGLDTSACIGMEPLDLVGIPAGGSFSGNGISGNTFIPQNASMGFHDITYNYTATNGCFGSNTQRIRVSSEAIVLSLEDTITCLSKFPIILNPGSFKEYLWQDGSTDPTYTVNGLGRYCYYRCTHWYKSNQV